MTLSASLAACRRCAASLTAPFVDSRISSFVRSWVVRDPIGRSGGRCEPAGGSMSPGGQRPPAGEVSPRSGPGARRRAPRPGPRRRAGRRRRAGAGPPRRRGARGSSVAALEASARGRSPTSAFTPALQEGRRGGVVALPPSRADAVQRTAEPARPIPPTDTPGVGPTAAAGAVARPCGGRSSESTARHTRMG